MLVITIGILGDSLTSGFVSDFASPHMWFSPTSHHAYEQEGFIDVFDRKKQEFMAQFHQLLSKTTHLKKMLPKISVRFQTVSRPGVTLAHYNPGIEATRVPEQFYGPLYARSQAANSQLDLAIVALGTNDTQDFNAMAVEIFLNMLSQEEFQQVIGTLKLLMPDLAQQLLQFTTENPQRQTSVVSKISISREENQAILKVFQECKLQSSQAVSFLQDWESKQYWNKTPDEMTQILKSIYESYQNCQHTDLRSYPFSMACILPPAYEGKDIIFPTYHALGKKIVEMRALVRSFTEEHGIECHDFQTICEQLDAEKKPKYYVDQIHLTPDFYKTLESKFPFIDILSNVVNTRINAFFAVLKSKNLYPEKDIAYAEQELHFVLSEVKRMMAKSNLKAEPIQNYNSLIFLGDRSSQERSSQDQSTEAGIPASCFEPELM